MLKKSISKRQFFFLFFFNTQDSTPLTTKKCDQVIVLILVFHSDQVGHRAKFSYHTAITTNIKAEPT